MAGVEGFEPPNGGIKTQYGDQHYQQVTELVEGEIPYNPFDSPWLPPKLPPDLRASER
jgi:hypothetical protein